MLAEHDRNIANQGYISFDTANHILLPVQVTLPASVQFGVVCAIVVPLCQKMQWFVPANGDVSKTPKGMAHWRGAER